MKRFCLTILISILISVNLSVADGYKSLWNDIEKIRANDLPASQIELLDKIIHKANREHSYGNLMRAVKERMELRYIISPDSFDVDVKQLEDATNKTSKNNVLYAIYNSLLGDIYREKASRSYRDRTNMEKMTTLSKEFFVKSLSNPHITASITTKELYPFFSKEKGTSLLVSLAYNADMFKEARDFYLNNGNRPYSLIMSLENLKQEKRNNKTLLHSLDSLISIYSDIDECCEAAIAKYRCLNEINEVTNKEKILFVRDALSKWGQYERSSELKNAELLLTRPSFEVVLSSSQIAENKEFCISLKNVRNISKITTKIWKTNLKSSDIATWKDKGISDDDFYSATLKSLDKSNAITITSVFNAPDYVYSEKDIKSPSLEKGIYIIETTSNRKDIKPVYSIIYVSNLYILSQKISKNKTRIAVVDLLTGQPIKNAKVTLHCRKNNHSTYISNKICDINGEIMFEGNDYPYMAYAYSDNDMFMPTTRISSSFGFYNNTSIRSHTAIFTDRAIYRPGQTLRVAVVAYKNIKGKDIKVDSAAAINLILKDSNYKVIAQEKLITDAYGNASTDFILPKNTLNGTFYLSDNRAGFTTIRVEEYKRPTFNVEFSKPNEKYHFGDTVNISGKAISFTGVPLQNAEVKYTVKRFWFPWLRHFNGNGNGNDIVSKGKATTSLDGTFNVHVPLTAIEDKTSGCYYFIIEADVTDAAGETQNGRLSLPVSDKKLWISCNLPNKIELSRLEDINFEVKNIAGTEIETDVNISINGGKCIKVKSNSNIDIKSLISGLPSGKHTLIANVSEEKIEKDFILFSLEDKTPATSTDEWFYITSNTFPQDNGSVFIQLGSSANNVHVLYSAIVGNNTLSTGTIELNNEIKTYELKYKEEYGDGVLISYAWIKDGKLYTRNTEIKKYLPNKKLDIKWTTFRDRLIPGQKEQWTLQLTRNDSLIADASLIATMYDISLDKITRHKWSNIYGLYRYLPYSNWLGTNSNSLQRMFVQADLNWKSTKELLFEQFPRIDLYGGRMYHDGYNLAMMSKSSIKRNSIASESRSFDSAMSSDNKEEYAQESTEEESFTNDVPLLRENLSETAFFYPSLVSDKDGKINISFTLPESITTWKFMSFAHDKEMCNSTFSDEIVASKDVMIQPNMPRFIRRGDKAQISARIFNLSDNNISGKAVMQLCDVETGNIIIEKIVNFNIAKDETTNVTFNFDNDIDNDLVVCKLFAKGSKFSDGEQHYLNILSDKEEVTNTHVITLDTNGTFNFKTDNLFSKGSTDNRLTLEFTDNPQWFVIQALPTITENKRKDAISIASKIYANILAQHISKASPNTKKAIDIWKAENNSSSLLSNLQKNDEVKDIMLEETPWVTEAEKDSERMQRLSQLFDDNLMNNRTNDAINQLLSYQLSNGSWGWWPGMCGNKYITLTVTEMLIRLEAMTESNITLKTITDKAIEYLTNVTDKDIKETKKKDNFKISSSNLQYLYIKSVRNDKFNESDNWLLKRLEQSDISSMSIYNKAIAAIIFHKTRNDKRATSIINSIKQYSVYSKEMGRYFDSPSAEYSWCDYKIPTEVIVIEAIKTITPEDRTTIKEMQQWLLQEKRTTSWDTPINSVNAIYAFTNGGSNIAEEQGHTSEVRLNGNKVKSNDAITGYVKATEQGNNFDISINKRHNNVSWLSLYGTYTTNIKDIDKASSGIKIQREIKTLDNKDITVGSRILVRITITADRDYDFVQVTDKRAACMEPVNQISGYNGRYYCSMKDNAAYYYFDMLSKGTHVIETEYYVDRKGSYTTGTCKIQCAYAPAFNGRTKADTIKVN